MDEQQTTMKPRASGWVYLSDESKAGLQTLLDRLGANGCSKMFGLNWATLMRAAAGMQVTLGTKAVVEQRLRASEEEIESFARCYPIRRAR